MNESYLYILFLFYYESRKRELGTFAYSGCNFKKKVGIFFWTLILEFKDLRGWRVEVREAGGPSLGQSAPWADSRHGQQAIWNRK
jgi:hypothetical protein